MYLVFTLIILNYSESYIYIKLVSLLLHVEDIFHYFLSIIFMNNVQINGDNNIYL